MAATLSADDETHLKALLEKMVVKVEEEKTIEDLTKVLPEMKKKQKTEFSFQADKDASNEEDEDGEEKGANTVSKLMWFFRTTPVPRRHLPFKAWKVEGLKEIYGKRVVI